MMREDWIESTIVESCGIYNNLRKPINSKERNERISGKKAEELFPYYGATGQVGYIDDYLTDGDFVLVGEDAAPFLDYSKDVAYKISGKTWVNNHAHILKSKFNDNFLLHYLNSFNFNGYVSGTTRLKLTQGRLKQIPIVLPSLPEQRAIVAKIEALFSDLDKGIADLKKAQEQLKVYRQAVLRKAFDINSKKYKIEEVSKEIFAGGDKPKDFFSKVKTVECSVPIIANSVANNGLYGYTKHARVNETAITIAARGSGTGHVELREKPFLPIVRLITLIPNLEKVVIHYLMYFLKNLNIERSGSAIPQLTIPMVKGFEIHLPSKEEQHQIVQEIESRLSVCDKVEQTISESLEKAKALRQSILKKAFEGTLLSEKEIAACKAAPDYEPASVLLEKIKAEKVAKVAVKKTSKKGKKK